MQDRQRVYVLLLIFILLLLSVLVRLINLQIFNHSFYVGKSQDQYTRIIELAAQRGDIVDRNGNILSTSIDTYSLYKYKHGWLARKLSFDEYLCGKKGRLVTEGDPSGVELYGALRVLEAGEEGMNITFTIDENIQYVAEREIEKQIKKYQAISGTVIVMDAETGEILALASKPDFDPNAYKSADKRLWHPRVVDPFEPGSTFKTITTAIALEEGVISEETMLEAKDSITVGGRVIKNSHAINWPDSRITISKMLEESINTGAVQIGLKLGPEKFYNGIKKFNFGSSTAFGLYGESKGIVNHWQRWHKPDIAMITFGQSIAVTPMQLLAAFSAFTNQGEIVKPFLIKKIESCDGKFVKGNARQLWGRAVSAKVADQVKKLLQNVVEIGTGKLGRITGFSVAGKTGTAQKASPGGRGYLQGHYIACVI